jgi:hypothetical protein
MLLPSHCCWTIIIQHLSPAEFVGGDPPVTLIEKIQIWRVTMSLSCHMHSNRRDAKKQYDLLRDQLDQHLSFQASQMETRTSRIWVV